MSEIYHLPQAVVTQLREALPIKMEDMIRLKGKKMKSSILTIELLIIDTHPDDVMVSVYPLKKLERSSSKTRYWLHEVEKAV